MICDSIRGQHTFWQLHWGTEDQSTIKMPEDKNMTDDDPRDSLNLANFKMPRSTGYVIYFLLDCLFNVGNGNVESALNL